VSSGIRSTIFFSKLHSFFLQGSFDEYLKQFKTDVFQNPKDFFKISVPGGLFTIQNNLSFVALSYMDAASFQVMSQLKILTTAVMSILMLRTKLDGYKWLSLFLLMAGVSVLEVVCSLFFI